MTLLFWIGGLILSAVSFLLGRAFSESEKILAEKRRIYEAFLISCPKPNSAYADLSDDEIAARYIRIGEAYSPFLLYAAPNVVLAANEFLKALDETQVLLSPDSEPLHAEYRKLAKSHNDMILEMRRDALGWSVFGYRGASRLPSDALEQAKRNVL